MMEEKQNLYHSIVEEKMQCYFFNGNFLSLGILKMFIQKKKIIQLPEPIPLFGIARMKWTTSLFLKV